MIRAATKTNNKIAQNFFNEFLPESDVSMDDGFVSVDIPFVNTDSWDPLCGFVCKVNGRPRLIGSQPSPAEQVLALYGVRHASQIKVTTAGHVTYNRHIKSREWLLSVAVDSGETALLTLAKEAYQAIGYAYKMEVGMPVLYLDEVLEAMYYKGEKMLREGSTSGKVFDLFNA